MIIRYETDATWYTIERYEWLTISYSSANTYRCCLQLKNPRVTVHWWNDTSLHVMIPIIGDVDESSMVGKAVNWSLRLMERFCLHECFEMLISQDMQVGLLSFQMLHFQWACYHKNQTIWNSSLEKLRELIIHNLLWRRRYYWFEITNKIIPIVSNKETFSLSLEYLITSYLMFAVERHKWNCRCHVEL